MEANFYFNNIVLVPAIAFVVSVFIKWINIKINSWKLNLSQTLWSWGMPSSHSAVVVSLATAITLKNWINSDSFAIVVSFAVIIIYDAINIRFEAWLHASAINKSLWEKKFKESLWHLPIEAFVGSVIWIVVAVLLYYI